MKVTAVVPLYNAEKYISSTLESLLNQTYPLEEIIVVDDSSSDKSLNIVESYCNKHAIIRLIRQKENKGVSAARNRGIQEAIGDWILFMDSDDTAHPTLLEKEINMIKRYKCDITPILAHPAYQQIDENGKVFKNSIFRGKQLNFDEQFGSLLVRNHIITPSGLLVNKKVLIDVGGFKVFPNIEDYELILRLSQIGLFIYVDEPLINYRRHNSNLTIDINRAKQDERNVLQQYDFSTIKDAVLKRPLSKEQNQLDYVNMLYRFDLWKEGFQELSIMENVENQVSYLFLKGIYFVKNHILNEAENCFQQILELNETHGATLNNLGVIFAIQGKKEKAQKLFEKAISHFPGYIDAEHNIKELEGNRNDYKWTWRELRKNLLRYS